MIRSARQALRGKAGRHCAYGVALGIVGMLIVVLPLSLRLRQTLRGLRTTRATYEAKMKWVNNRPELERRIKLQTAALEEVEAKLLLPEGVDEFTQQLAIAARRAGCLVSSVQAAEPRAMKDEGSRPSGNKAKGRSKTKSRSDVTFVEQPLHLSLRAEYRQVVDFLKFLEQQERFVQVTRLAVQPDQNDRERLVCQIEIVAFSLGSVRAREV